MGFIFRHEVYLNGSLLTEDVEYFVDRPVRVRHDYFYRGRRSKEYLDPEGVSWVRNGGLYFHFPVRRDDRLIFKRYFCGLLWSVFPIRPEHDYPQDTRIVVFGQQQAPPRPPAPVEEAPPPPPPPPPSPPSLLEHIMADDDDEPGVL